MLRQLVKENWKPVLGLIVAGIAMTFLIYRDTRGILFFKVASFTCLMWIFLWLGNAYVSDWLDSKISWKEMPVQRLLAGLGGMVVYSVLATYGLVLFYRTVVGLRIGSNLDGMLYTTIAITTFITMFMTSRTFLFNWRQAAVDAEKLKQESVKAQYDSLKSQVNPHFLFNSLNALTNLVYQDQDKAVKFIKQLSEVYRYVLDTRDKEVVPFTDELHFIESYLFLQQIRFGDKLQVTMDFPTQNFHVAPLALQMLLENAIKHNEVSADRPLQIKLYVKGKHLVVENSPQRKKVLPGDSPGLGLDNIKKRYEFLSAEKVVVEETRDFFSVSIPIID